MVRRWLPVGMILVLISLLTVSCGVPQEDYDSAVAERDATQAQVASLQSDLAAVKSDLVATESARAAVESELAATESAITAAESELAATESAITAVESELATAQSDLVAAQDEINALEILTLALERPTTPVEVIRNIEYGSVKGIPLLLDIYVPDTAIATPMPAIIYIHGGSWKGGDKSDPFRVRSIRALAEHGFFVASINYRLSGVAPFPAAVEDCKCAVRWLRANAEKYNVDPDRIGVWGGSAGGHLVMMVGCADETAELEGNGGWAEFSSRVQAVCSYYGVSDLVRPYTEWGAVESGVVIQFLGGTYQEKPEIYEAASPINYVTSDDPPLLLVHGENDTLVDIIESEVMYEAYQQAGLEATLIRVSGADHVFYQVTANPISPSLQEIERIVLVFFLKHLLRTG